MRRLAFAAFAVAFAVSLAAACGYRPLYGEAEGERLHVALVQNAVPYAVAADEVLAGVRDELVREGALLPGDGYPRIEVEVLRADESSEGISALAGAPAARGTEVGIVARAWVQRAKEAPKERDTGDVHALSAVALDTREGRLDPRADVLHHEDALRAVARRAGQKLGRRILGHPIADDEGVGRER